MGPSKLHFEQRQRKIKLNVAMGRCSIENAFFIPFCNFHAPLQNPAKLFASDGRYRLGLTQEVMCAPQLNPLRVLLVEELISANGSA